MSANNGGSAFPTGTQVAQNTATGETVIHQYLSDGMTLRDYFAAKAMQTLVGCVFERHGDTNHIIDNDGRVSLHLRAYEHADAMLKARES